MRANASNSLGHVAHLPWPSSPRSREISPRELPSPASGTKAKTGPPTDRKSSPSPASHKTTRSTDGVTAAQPSSSHSVSMGTTPSLQAASESATRKAPIHAYPDTRAPITAREGSSVVSLNTGL
ncbi:hypothetical protein LX36DRAFT_288204 [Colletotrichum falcatum]|nr:hypothetical protein LX36DRAFT_288204 [Colletotrichum falcatum]